MLEELRMAKYRAKAEDIPTTRLIGQVTRVIGLIIEANGPAVSVGDRCIIINTFNEEISAETVGFREQSVLLMPYGDMRGVAPGCKVYSHGKPVMVRASDALLGRVLDGFGEPMDGKGAVEGTRDCPIHRSPPNPLHRAKIVRPLVTGIRSIDSALTCGKGQRVGIFSGSGVGKSTLLGCVAKYCDADVIVVGLIGERGREVRGFIEENLGEEGMKRSVVVVATSDQAALVRINAAWVATTIAEYFRDQGKDVLLVMDSLTRFSMAQREVGLAVGEPPATKGYTPSVFALMPKLLERAGTAEHGSITGFYTVLVEADDMNDPIGDAARSILDGHIVLSRALADRGHYPPVDVLASASRLLPYVTSSGHRELAYQLREALATYREAEDLINIGAYKKGSNPRIDKSVAVMDEVTAFLRQKTEDNTAMPQMLERLEKAMKPKANA
jgi:FliI/YscN family ATPase